MDRIIGYWDGETRICNRMELLTFNNSNQVTARARNTYRNIDTGNWTAGNITALRTAFENGTPFYWLWGGRYYRGRRNVIQLPSENAFPSYEPTRWMEEVHPFDPLTAYDILSYDSYADLPDEGIEGVAYHVEDGDGKVHPLVWRNGAYQALSTVGPTALRHDYTFEADQEVAVRDNTGAHVGDQVVMDALGSSPGIPAADLALSTDRDKLTAGNQQNLQIDFNLRLRNLIGDGDSVWQEGGAQHSARPTKYRILVSLLRYEQGSLGFDYLHNSVYQGDIDAAAPVSEVNIGLSRIERTFNATDDLFLQISGAGQNSNSDNRFSRGVVVLAGSEMAIRRFDAHTPPEADPHSIAGYAGMAIPDGATVSADLPTAIDTDQYPRAVLSVRFERDDHDVWARQELTFDLRKVGLAADATAAKAAAIESDYSKHLWIRYKNDTPGRPYIYQGKPWDGWAESQLWAFRLVPYGSSSTINGFAIKGIDRADEMEMSLDMEFGRL